MTRAPLTDRQREVLDTLIATGTVKSTSRRLDITVQTVKSHIKAARARLGMTGRPLVTLVIAYDRANRGVK